MIYTSSDLRDSIAVDKKLTQFGTVDSLTDVKTTASIVSRELVRLIRGNRSQNALNRKLGYGYNQLHRWETGKTRIGWEQFVRLCDACGMNLQQALSRVFFYAQPPSDSGSLIRHLLQNQDKREMETRLCLSKAALNRRLRGQVDPKLDSVISLMMASDFTLSQFVTTLTGASIPSLRHETSFYSRRKAEVFDDPLFPVARASFLLKEYRLLADHPPGWLAKRLGISQAREETLLRSLEKKNWIAKIDGKYCPVPVGPNATRHQTKYSMKVQKFWFEHCQMLREAPKTIAGKGSYSTMVFMLTREEKRKLRDLYVEFVQKLRQEFKTKEEYGLEDAPHQLQVVMMQSFDPHLYPENAEGEQIGKMSTVLPQSYQGYSKNTVKDEPSSP